MNKESFDHIGQQHMLVCNVKTCVVNDPIHTEMTKPNLLNYAYFRDMAHMF